MRKPSFTYGSNWLPNRRVTLMVIALAVLLAVTTTVALITGRNEHPVAAPSTPSPVGSSTSHAKEPAAGSGPVSRPPRISDPVEFAKAAAVMLWTYDTRSTSHDQQLAGMQTWMTTEGEYGDWPSVNAQVPDPLLWSRMADQKQYASAVVAEAQYPAAFKQALADDPSKITLAYIYAVTVTGKQTIAWAEGGAGAEDRSITLAVQCRPSRDCSLVAIAPTVAP